MRRARTTLASILALSYAVPALFGPVGCATDQVNHAVHLEPVSAELRADDGSAAVVDVLFEDGTTRVLTLSSSNSSVEPLADFLELERFVRDFPGATEQPLIAAGEARVARCGAGEGCLEVAVGDRYVDHDFELPLAWGVPRFYAACLLAGPAALWDVATLPVVWLAWQFVKC